MQKLYKTSDIFVFPSLRETTGTVLFEAMVNGLPIVTFNQNGAALLVDETCGFRIDVNSDLRVIKSKFASAIQQLIENQSLKEELGLNAYKRVIEDYTWENKCKKFYFNFLI